MMSKSEVTVAQYRTCVEAGACSPPGCSSEKYCNWSQRRETHPVNYVSWTQMRTFGEWVGADLPTEAQWEFAARSRGQNRPYPWRNQAPDCSYADFGRNDYSSCGGEGTSPVCTHNRGNSAQGLCDFAGNLYEWVLDEYESSYRGAPTDGSPRCRSANCSANDANRVIRGGYWNRSASYLRAAYRGHNSPSGQVNYVGFRLARSSSP